MENMVLAPVALNIGRLIIEVLHNCNYAALLLVAINF